MLGPEKRLAATINAEVTNLALGSTAPIMVACTQERSLLDLIASNRESLIEMIEERGAILFRGFDIFGGDGFRSVAQALCSNLSADYGDLPKTETADTYEATPYPSRLDIHFHNEASHTRTAPRRQIFWCVQSAVVGGAWRVCNGRLVASLLPENLVSTIQQNGILYQRRFIPGFDVSWQRFFGVDDRDKLPAAAQKLGYDFAWVDDLPHITRRAPGLLKVSRFEDLIWFNQLLLHHPAGLPAPVRTSTSRLFGSGRTPRNASYGDGAAISDETIDTIKRVLLENAITIETRVDDVLVLDNILCSHSRSPFQGERKVRVALGDMFEVAAFAA